MASTLTSSGERRCGDHWPAPSELERRRAATGRREGLKRITQGRSCSTLWPQQRMSRWLTMPADCWSKENQAGGVRPPLPPP